MKKLIIFAALFLAFVFTASAVYTITVGNEADAVAELSKTDAPIIAQQSCGIIEIKKPVSTIAEVSKNPKTIFAFLYYSVNGELDRATIQISTLKTKEDEIKDLVARECEKKLLEITSEKASEPKNVVIDYLLGDLNGLKNASYDLVAKTWNQPEKEP